jgi:hypothetical protein
MRARTEDRYRRCSSGHFEARKLRSLAEATVSEDHDAIGVADGRKSVGDDQHGPTGHYGPQSVHNRGLGLRVKSRCRLVEYQHGSVLDECAGESEAPTLTS